MPFNVRTVAADGLERLNLSTLSEDKALDRYEDLRAAMRAGAIDGHIYVEQDGMPLGHTSEEEFKSRERADARRGRR